MTQANIGHNSGNRRTSVDFIGVAAGLLSVALVSAGVIGIRKGADYVVVQAAHSLIRDTQADRIALSVPPRAPGF